MKKFNDLISSQISEKLNNNTDTVFVNCSITVFFYEKFQTTLHSTC